MITVSNLSVERNGHSILRDLSFSVPNGSMTAIVGPNGSGKTTLVRAILGLQELSSGTIQCETDTVGYVPQSLPIDETIPLHGWDFIELNTRSLPKHTRKDAISQAIQHVDAKAFAKTRLAYLSGGQFQRILLARALVTDPDLLMLDEPTSGLDIEATDALYTRLQSLVTDHGKTVVMISHDVDMISQFVTHVVCINKTLVCAGPPDKALSDASMQNMYGAHMTFNPHHPHDHRV